MNPQRQMKVAVLLATYNGARFVEEQVTSLKLNDRPFTLHWLDDHSTDNTKEIVRNAARNASIDLREWHQTQHLGVPSTFFQLLECVEADVYLFCDQDDIWQPGKIDTMAANLLPEIASPVLCFSDSLMFSDDKPTVLRPVSEVVDADIATVLHESMSFMPPLLASGHTQAFTRCLRDIFIRHKEIARKYALGHDNWMYLIAVASGTARMLSNVPTALYRRHEDNLSNVLYGRDRTGVRITGWNWPFQQLIRRGVSKQAEGFLLATPTLPSGPKLERLAALAQLVATLDRRQSLSAFLRLMRRGVMLPYKHLAVSFAAACLFSNASPQTRSAEA